MKRSSSRSPRGNQPANAPVVGLRIIGGSLRGRRLQYSGDVRTRPMKDRVREAVFNLLGPRVVGSHAIDLFAGSGAIGLEAISRGAVRATLIERHLPTVKVIEQNVAALEIGECVEVVFGDAFVWTQRFAPADAVPLSVFCCPPYNFYQDRRDEVTQLIHRWTAVAPARSLLVVEADERFDFGRIPQPDRWNVRVYSPAVIGIFG